MSFLGSKEDAKKYAMEADTQIDGLAASSTSPVRDGSTDPGGAPLNGKHEFSTERTRPPVTGGVIKRQLGYGEK